MLGEIFRSRYFSPNNHDKIMVWVNIMLSI